MRIGPEYRYEMISIGVRDEAGMEVEEKISKVWPLKNSYKGGVGEARRQIIRALEE